MLDISRIQYNRIDTGYVRYGGVQEGYITQDVGRILFQSLSKFDRFLGWHSVAIQHGSKTRVYFANAFSHALAAAVFPSCFIDVTTRRQIHHHVGLVVDCMLLHELHTLLLSIRPQACRPVHLKR